MSRDPMPAEFNELAAYNGLRLAERAAWPPEYSARMADLQAQFDAWNEWQMLRDGFRPETLPDGGTVWVRPGEGGAGLTSPRPGGRGIPGTPR